MNITASQTDALSSRTTYSNAVQSKKECPMVRFQKLGGLAALYEALAYVAGMVFFIGMVDYLGVSDPVQKVALLAENQSALTVLNLIIYVIFGVALVVLSLALHDRLKDKNLAVMQTATAFGLIWATVVIASGMISNVGMEVVVPLYATDPGQATTIWTAIDAVVAGIGGGIEILGGLWALLVSWVALRHGGLPKLLNYLGLLVGVAGIATLIPALGEVAGMAFGLTQIVWFAWLGIAMMRSRASIGA